MWRHITMELEFLEDNNRELSNDNGNENCKKKATGLYLFSKTTTLHMHHAFLYIS